MPGHIRTRARSAIASLALALGFALALSACGDDDVTDPGNQDIVGEWTYAFTNVVGGGFTCSVTGITLTFTRTGGTVEGTIVAVGTDNLTCVGSGGTQSTDFTGEGELEGLTVDGSNVAFTIPTFHGDWDNTGTVNGNSMGGNAIIPLDFGSTIVLNGTWEATRN